MKESINNEVAGESTQKELLSNKKDMTESLKNQEKLDGLEPLNSNEIHKGDDLQKERKKQEDYTHLIPVPADAPAFDRNTPYYFNEQFKRYPKYVYSYHAHDGGLVGYMVRWEIPQQDGTLRKEMRPFIFVEYCNGRRGWKSKGFPVLRPLYNLPDMINRTEAPILICEGEKSAEAGKILFPDYVAVTSPQGSKSLNQTDWSYVKARNCLIAPDCDDPGQKYADMVAKICRKAGAHSIHKLDTQALSHTHIEKGCVIQEQNNERIGYDLADALADGWTPELMQQHQESLIALYAEKKKGKSPDAQIRKRLEVGSDVEISTSALNDLFQQHKKIIYTEGAFWYYDKTDWQAFPEHYLRLVIHTYDGVHYETPSGEESCVKLGKSRIDSILHEMSAQVTEEVFFVDIPEGINCANGFITLDKQGIAVLKEHHPDYRCRHTLPGSWHPDSPTWKEGSLHSTLLNGVFQGDTEEDIRDKMKLLQEVCGSSALGYATKIIQPRAVILKGERAENRKSQVLDMMRGLLPLSAISTVTATRMGDERHVLGLVGKLLNASDELSGSAAISSDTFKAIITGEPVSGRDVYKSRVEFRPQAQHVFATNTLPSFQGGMDRGVQRRLLVVPFNCVIPKEKRIENIGKRIPEEEPDLLLAWAVEGASRLIKQHNFTIPQSSKETLNDWLFSADSVQAWFQESVILIEKNGDYPHIKTNYAYSHYKNWAETEGFRKEQILGINGFVQRMKTMDHIHYKRKNDGAIFVGMNIKRESVVETSTPDPQNKYYDTQVIGSDRVTH